MPTVPPCCPKRGGIWVQCSESVEELFGQTIPGLQGKTCGALYCSTCHRINSDSGMCPSGKVDCPALSS
jgi:hypothetical protein